MKKKLFKKIGVMLLGMTLVVSMIIGCGVKGQSQVEKESASNSQTMSVDTDEDILDNNVENKGENAGQQDPQEGLEQMGKPEIEEPQVTDSTDGLPALAVDGTQLVDEDGNPVQLRGLSTHGMAWFPGYVNEDFFRELKEVWKTNVVRLAMYTHENGGYCSGGDKEKLKQLVKDGVEYATNNDLYVIIDWHVLNDQNPNKYKEEAKDFFEEMSTLYGEYTNVIYEICNEPNGGTSWKDIKSYAEEVIPVIREHDKDAVILVGTPNWSQYVDQAAKDPIKDYDNIMYTLHFYAATHTDWLRNNLVDAIEDGLPIFVSEFGICDASGNGGIDAYQAEKWVELMNDYGVSYVAWNISNKNETSAIFKSSVYKFSGFEESDLSENGKWLFEMLSGDSEFTPSQGNGNQGHSQGGTSKSDSQSASQSKQEQSDQQQENQQAGNQQADGQGQTIAQGQTTTQGDLNIQATVANSWESEGKVFYQYNLTITNNSDLDIKGWSVKLKYTNTIEFSDGWNASFSADGDTLTVKPASYNETIVAGGNITDIGFIMSGPVGTKLSSDE